MSATVHNQDRKQARILRLSITGECNLECFYCKPLGKSKDLFLPKTLIQPSDVSKLVKIVGELGVNKVVIEGGEPLLRKDVANFVKSAYAHKGIQDVKIVTNGTYLKTYADALRKLGLRKVDINFDSINYSKYQAITRKDDLFRVLDGIEKIEKLNFIEIRLNIFLFNGINQDELVEISRMTKDRDLHIRFIEYHPKYINGNDPNASRLGLSVLTAQRKIDDYQKLYQIHDLATETPVPTFKFQNGTGKISFLSKMEIQMEESIPRVVFNADGALFHEAFPNKTLAILADIRKDAKDVKLHRAVEKILFLGSDEERVKPVQKPSRMVPKSSSRASASARR